jgi:hypothetical protein
VLIVLLAANPPVRGTGLPKFVPSTVNCTDPVGEPVLGAIACTVAVKAKLCPNTGALAEARTTEFVVALVTV